MPNNINSLPSTGKNHSSANLSVKSEVREAIRKHLLVIMTAAAIGLTGNLAWAQEPCPEEDAFQYGNYNKACLKILLNRLRPEPEKPCSRICSNKNYRHAKNGKKESFINKEQACISEGCSVYCRKMYPRNDSTNWPGEIESVRRKLQGKLPEGIRGICPYSMTLHGKLKRNDDIEFEHIVSLAEAHDSGLCKPERKKDRDGFGNDPWNLIMAKKSVNRYKSDKDFRGWNLHKGIPPDSQLPSHTKEGNKCWFASRVIQVRTKWDLTIDGDEKKVLENALDACTDFSLKPLKEYSGKCGK